MSGPNGEDTAWLTELGMKATDDPGPVPPPAATAPHDRISALAWADLEPLFQSIAPRTWTRVLLPWLPAPRASALWVRNDAEEHAFITIGRDGTVGLQGGEGIRWLILTGEKHPDLR